jgi:hypothetical protein
MAFADNLSFNPWHSLPEHRPLGNQNRARKKLYLELSKLRQSMNETRRLEPTGEESFPTSSVAGPRVEAPVRIDRPSKGRSHV